MISFKGKALPRIALAAAIWLGSAGASMAQQCPVGEGQTNPGAKWASRDAADAGWSKEGLARAMKTAQEAHYAAGMVIYRGEVIASFGDIERPYQTRSIRKSFLNAVAGQLIAKGKLNLDATLGQLGIDEKKALTASEKTATVRDLMMSKSGVYLRASYEAPSERERPPRGSHPPGSFWFYNNWDFNALGTIVARAGGAPLFEQFEAGVAKPIGMQDFSLADTKLHYESLSLHPAYLVDMSTRDRARFGLLYMRDGCWNGRQVVPADWVRESVSPLTRRGEHLDYGYLWWSQRGLASVGMSERIYMARGNQEQYISLIPEADLVLVLTADMGMPAWLSWLQPRPTSEGYGAVLREVLRSRPQRS